MPPYTLDYTSEPDTTPVRPRSRTAPPVARKLFAAGLFILSGVSVAGNFLLLNHQRYYQNNADRQALQYDSLLSAKLLSDQQAAELRRQLLRLRQSHERLRDEFRVQTASGNK